MSEDSSCFGKFYTLGSDKLNRLFSLPNIFIFTNFETYLLTVFKEFKRMLNWFCGEIVDIL